MYDRLLLYFRLARLTPYFSAYFIKDCRYAMSCVILLLMRDMVSFQRVVVWQLNFNSWDPISHTFLFNCPRCIVVLHLAFFMVLAYIKDGSGRGCFQPRSLFVYRFCFRFAGLRGAVFFLSACIVWILITTVTNVVIIVQTVRTQSLTPVESLSFAVLYSISLWCEYKIEFNKKMNKLTWLLTFGRQ